MTATHDLDLGPRRVVKRFRSWDRGEPDREWRGLKLLQQYAPGLAPEPLGRRTEDGRPVIVMSRVPGVALGRSPLSEVQLAAVAAAMTRLHTVVPPHEIDRLPRRLWSASEAVHELRDEVRTAPTTVSDEVRTAYAAGARWIRSDEAARFARADVPAVLAQADGNLANVIWDGGRCGLVDFEDSGASDRAYEIADLVEHVTAWLPGILDAEALLNRLDLDAASRRRVHHARRVLALFWLVVLSPGNPGHRRNPPGSVDRQAQRLLELLD